MILWSERLIRRGLICQLGQRLRATLGRAVRRIAQRDRLLKRRLLLDVTRNIQGGTVLVACSGPAGVFEIDARSDILQRILLDKCYEPDLVAAIMKYHDPKRDAVDIGANIGLFTVLLASLLNEDRKVLSVEPNDSARELLVRNLRRNKCAERVIVHEGLVAEAKGRRELHVIPGKEEYSSLGCLEADPNGSACIVKSVDANTLDELVAQYDIAPGILKVDAEGAEYAIMSASERVLEMHRPLIFMEVSDHMLKRLGHSSRQLLTFLERHGYCTMDLLTGKGIAGMGFEGNIVAIPRQTNYANKSPNCIGH